MKEHLGVIFNKFASIEGVETMDALRGTAQVQSLAAWHVHHGREVSTDVLDKFAMMDEEKRIELIDRFEKGAEAADGTAAPEPEAAAATAADDAAAEKTAAMLGAQRAEGFLATFLKAAMEQGSQGGDDTENDEKGRKSSNAAAELDRELKASGKGGGQAPPKKDEGQDPKVKEKEKDGDKKPMPWEKDAEALGEFQKLATVTAGQLYEVMGFDKTASTYDWAHGVRALEILLHHVTTPQSAE